MILVCLLLGRRLAAERLHARCDGKEHKDADVVGKVRVAPEGDGVVEVKQQECAAEKVGGRERSKPADDVVDRLPGLRGFLSVFVVGHGEAAEGAAEAAAGLDGEGHACIEHVVARVEAVPVCTGHVRGNKTPDAERGREAQIDVVLEPAARVDVPRVRELLEALAKLDAEKVDLGELVPLCHSLFVAAVVSETGHCACALGQEPGKVVFVAGEIDRQVKVEPLCRKRKIAVPCCAEVVDGVCASENESDRAQQTAPKLLESNPVGRRGHALGVLESRAIDEVRIVSVLAAGSREESAEPEAEAVELKHTWAIHNFHAFLAFFQLACVLSAIQIVECK
eukprot:comp16786_c0_seq1/m.27308 comp16786_c0_seq1/g.27308  ORF comp16786_c0_seq1/g.27308 comp16786_c0_seq1/m.27308 type:complete len:338 (+) comp16786_c0_seq1:102-1115(+)